ncbi:hypothetical protein Snoj_09870 [Streptomyces nojiriensis]|uniref:Uncharacterized protein n=1 Tax=Streptomyces nojiriensis TaxID=66374 RepID=A0ABQ3SG57_9ACTN|nr:hypothetical protein GCM10010205_66720 [Streptomyces nojiriensis]GHI67069.1 hypothetical protein Snoj_09870 [Streptomyces nojiriensis]
MPPGEGIWSTRGGPGPGRQTSAVARRAETSRGHAGRRAGRVGIDRLEVGGCGHDEHALVADAPGEASGCRVLRGEPVPPRVERGDRVRDDPESGRTGGGAGRASSSATAG